MLPLKIILFLLINEINKVFFLIVSQPFIQKVVQLHIKHLFACWSRIPIFYIKTSQFSHTGRETPVFYDGVPALTLRAYREWVWVCTGDVKRYEGVGLPYFWRTTRINSVSENSRTTWEIEMTFCPSQQNYLRNISRLKPHPLYSFCACANDPLRYHTLQTYFSIWYSTSTS